MTRKIPIANRVSNIATLTILMVIHSTGAFAQTNTESLGERYCQTIAFGAGIFERICNYPNVGTGDLIDKVDRFFNRPQINENNRNLDREYPVIRYNSPDLRDVCAPLQKPGLTDAEIGEYIKWQCIKE